MQKMLNTVMVYTGGHQIHPTSAGYPRMASAFALSILENFKASP